MPWSLERRDGKVCVIKESDGSVAGCHATRADAIKQQRALYAQESRMASIYADLDAVVADAPAPIRQEVKAGSELVKIEIGKDNEALTASLLSTLDSMSQRQQATDQALIAALHQIGTRDSVVNVEAPNVNVEAPNVTIEPPAVTVEAPKVTVEAPNVSVSPEIHMGATKKTVVFERDFDGRVVKADVTEE